MKLNTRPPFDARFASRPPTDDRATRPLASLSSWMVLLTLWVHAGACGRHEEPPAPGTSAPSPGTEASESRPRTSGAALTPAPSSALGFGAVEKGRLLLPVLGVPDPKEIRDRYTNLIASAVFMPLRLPGGGGLAERIDVQGRQVTILLSPAYAWSPGRPVTAGDLLAAWKRKLEGDTASDLYFIEGARCSAEGTCPGREAAIRALDERRVVFETTEVLRHADALFQHANFSPVPGHLSKAELDGEWWRRWSYGPYRVASWDDTGFLLEPNPSYVQAASGQSGPEAVATKAWRGIFSRDAEFSLAAFSRGDVDWVVAPLPTGRFSELRRLFGAALQTEPSLCVFGFFVRDLPREVREALYCAVDRDMVALRYLAAGQQPAFDLAPPDFGRDERTGLTQGCAAALAASTPLGRPLRVLANTEGGSDRVVNSILEGARRAARLDYELTATEWRTMLSLWREGRRGAAEPDSKKAGKDDSKEEGRHELLRYSMCGTPAALSFLSSLEAGNQENFADYDEASYRAALLALRQETDGDDAALATRAALAALRRDLPFIPVYQHSQAYLVRESLEGFVPDELGHHPLHRLRATRGSAP